MLLLPEGLVKLELFFEMLEGGFEVEETGFEGTADGVTLVVQYPVEQAVMLPHAGILFAGVGFDIVEAKHRIELFKVGVVIIFHDVMNDLREGTGSGSFAVVDL